MVAASSPQDPRGDALDSVGRQPSRNSVDKSRLGRTQEAVAWRYWQLFSQSEKPNIFNYNEVCIAPDSGLSDVDELMNGMKYINAGIMTAFIIANTVMITKVDVAAVIHYTDRESARSSSKFLLTKFIVKHLCVDNAGEIFGMQLDCLVPLVEVIVLWGYMFLILSKFIRIAWAVAKPSSFGQRHEYIRWAFVSELAWTYLPQISRFSAMQLLCFVSPAVFGTQAYAGQKLVKHRRKDARGKKEMFLSGFAVVRYILQCALCFIIGFDAFVVKYRMASWYIEQQHFTLMSWVSALIFLFQVMGIKNLKSFVRQRLFAFIIGGEDGKVSKDEMARWDCWSALMAKKIYDHFGFFKGSIVILGFDCYDFQSLALDDSNKTTKMGLKKSGIFPASPSLIRTLPSQDFGMDFASEEPVTPSSALRMRVIEEDIKQQMQAMEATEDGWKKVHKVREKTSRDTESFIQNVHKLGLLTKELQGRRQPEQPAGSMAP
eukprot:TRINITY_DN1635_c0_g1_i1.p1 TRINITY_DN1635_c0_g1~~TRINITY_DN1635_c0_g1_i1.p1  ORF type:complete len:489 (+),score=72.54 TRINITY_DN1635_c0_g1_i1:96-1562(+)